MIAPAETLLSTSPAADLPRSECFLTASWLLLRSLLCSSQLALVYSTTCIRLKDDHHRSSPEPFSSSLNPPDKVLPAVCYGTPYPYILSKSHRRSE